MTLVLVIAVFLMAAALLWLLFPDEAWYLDDDDAPVITSLYEYKRERRS